MKRLPLSIIFAAFLISASLCMGERDTAGLIMYAAAAVVLFLYSCCRK